MRVDRFLKVSRIIKRRTVANEVCDSGRVSVNGRISKPGTVLKPGDLITIAFGGGPTSFRVLSVQENVRKGQATEMYEMIEDARGDGTG